MKSIFSRGKLFSRNVFLHLTLLLAGLSIGLSSCVSAHFDQVALDNAKLIKDKLPAVMKKATKAFSENETEINAVLASIGDAQKHAAETPKNKEVGEQWRILKEGLVQPFFDRWKSDKKLGKVFIDEQVKQVENSLSAIIRAENAKPKN